MKKKSPLKSYTAYIVRCSDGTFYTGMTSDLERRIGRHNLAGPKKDTWSKYTRSRQPVVLVFSFCDLPDIRSAFKAENYIKSLPRPRKEKLISGDEKTLNLLKEAVFTPPPEKTSPGQR